MLGFNKYNLTVQVEALLKMCLLQDGIQQFKRNSL